MISKWFRIKEEVIRYRLRGNSLGDIKKKFGIPKATLSGWFKNVKLSDSKRKILDKRWRETLVLSRKKAVAWHNKQRAERIEIAQDKALVTLSRLNINDKNILELALAMLYLGEGAKTAKTSLGNSDPEILSFFVKSMETLYGLDRRKVRCDLHLRADQDVEEIKHYWSRKLRIPLSGFTSASIDKRTLGRKTYPHYKGVCILNYSNIAIQRKLVYLSRQFCGKIIKGG